MGTIRRDDIAGAIRFFHVIAAAMNARSRWTGIATGDQAMFVTRAAVRAHVGGYREIALMEDIALSASLRRTAAAVHRAAGEHVRAAAGKSTASCAP